MMNGFKNDSNKRIKKEDNLSPEEKDSNME
jgi:hypothetical protein